MNSCPHTAGFGRMATVVNEPALSTRALSSVLYQGEGSLTKLRNNLTRDADDKTWDRHSVTALGD
jgi:hypothetical protein